MYFIYLLIYLAIYLFIIVVEVQLSPFANIPLKDVLLSNYLKNAIYSQIRMA